MINSWWIVSELQNRLKFQNWGVYQDPSSSPIWYPLLMHTVGNSFNYFTSKKLQSKGRKGGQYGFWSTAAHTLLQNF